MALFILRLCRESHNITTLSVQLHVRNKHQTVWQMCLSKHCG